MTNEVELSSECLEKDQNYLMVAPSTVLANPGVLEEALEAIQMARRGSSLLLSRIVFEAHHHDLWKQWPVTFDSFEDWGFGVLEKKKSSLYALSKTWEIFVAKHQVSIDRLRGIDFSKLSAAAPHVNEKNIEEILQMCETKNLFDLQKFLRSSSSLKEAVDGTKEKRFTFLVNELQSEVIQEAFEVAKELSGTESPGKLLEYVCASFVVTDGLESKESHLDRCVQHLEALFNVKIEVSEKPVLTVDGTCS